MTEAKDVSYKLAKESNRKDILFSLAMGEGTGRFYAGASDGALRDITLPGGDADVKPVDLLDVHTSYVTGVARNGKTLVSGGYDKRLVWWDLGKGEPMLVRDNAHARWIRGVEMSPDGKFVATVADDMVCSLWDLGNGKKFQELEGHEGITPNHFDSMLYCCSFSPNGQYIATGDRIGKIVIWEVSTGKEVKALSAPGFYTWDPKARIHSIGGLRSMAFSQDGKILATGGMGKVGNIDHLGGKARVEFFDVTKGESLGVVESEEFKGLVETVTFGPEGKWLAATGGDHKGWLLFIDVAERKIIREDGVSSHIHETAFSRDFSMIYGVGHNRAYFWEKEIMAES
jgi:WD40 repeat protein